eukprot:1720725-Pleurochrysis_carterae.AAC.1
MLSTLAPSPPALPLRPHSLSALTPSPPALPLAHTALGSAATMRETEVRSFYMPTTVGRNIVTETDATSLTKPNGYLRPWCSKSEPREVSIRSRFHPPIARDHV